MTIGDRCHKLELLLKCCPDVIDLIDYFRLVYLGRVCHLGPAAWLRSRAATHLVCVVGSRFSPASTGQKTISLMALQERPKSVYRQGQVE
jgi:hypothetical protein